MAHSVSVKNLKRFEIIDESGVLFCGGWQEWYKTIWKRYTGCGPTVITGIIHYLRRTDNIPDQCLPSPKCEFEALMDEVWRFVTPTVRGLPSAAALTKGARVYLDVNNLPYTLEELDIPKNKRLRPEFSEVVTFIAKALAADTPVAFLSLDKGEEERLDSWHWVTILTLDYEADGSRAEAGVADEGRFFEVDLRKWYDTTPLGGGFVRFTKSD